MKFLLKQKLHYEKEQTIYYLYPNQFSRWIVKRANEYDLILEKEYEFEGKYKHITRYLILENDFKRLLRAYKRKILKKRSRFNSRPYLEQMILLLRYIFKRNNNAKEASSYSASQKAYNDKSKFLEIALEIAQKVKNPHFSYGWQEDPNESFHCYVYYFQLGTKQVSFHDAILYPSVPEFEGQWVGYRNESFPF